MPHVCSNMLYWVYQINFFDWYILGFKPPKTRSFTIKSSFKTRGLTSPRTVVTSNGVLSNRPLLLCSLALKQKELCGDIETEERPGFACIFFFAFLKGLLGIRFSRLQQIQESVGTLDRWWYLKSWHLKPSISSLSPRTFVSLQPYECLKLF